MYLPIVWQQLVKNLYNIFFNRLDADKRTGYRKTALLNDKTVNMLKNIFNSDVKELCFNIFDSCQKYFPL